MTIHYDVTINIGSNDATKTFLDILSKLLEDPHGSKKQEISDKLDKLLADIKSTV